MAHGTDSDISEKDIALLDSHTGANQEAIDTASKLREDLFAEWAGGESDIDQALDDLLEDNQEKYRSMALGRQDTPYERLNEQKERDLQSVNRRNRLTDQKIMEVEDSTLKEQFMSAQMDVLADSYNIGKIEHKSTPKVGKDTMERIKLENARFMATGGEDL